METVCPPGYHLNGFVATHALGHMRAYDREGTVISALLENDVVFASFTYI